jgi:hypothetical protein
MIIHSPIISGSLTFADGSTFTLPDGGNYSGSFSGSIQISEVQSHLIPDTTEVYDLGSATNRFRDIYLSDATIRLGSGKFGITGGIFQMTDNDDVPMTLGVGSMQLKPAGFPSISLTSTATGFNLVDEDDEPAPMQVKSLSINSASNSVTSTVIRQKESADGGGVTFLEVGSSQCVRYRIRNNDLIANLFYSYTDCDGNPVTGAQVLANSTDTVTFQQGTFQRTAGTDNYHITLFEYVNADYAVAEIKQLEISTTGSSDNVVIRLDDNDGSGTPKLTITVSGSDTPADLQTGNIVVSGSNGTSTITNDLPGEGLAVTDSTGSLTPIKARTFELEDPDTGDIITLSVSSGSLNTTATNSSGSAIADPKSNLSGSFTGSFGLTGDITSEADCVKIGTELNPICDIYATRITGSLSGTVNGINIVDVKSDVDAILSGSAADKDSFAEIVTLINSVDTTNDTVFAGFVTSSNAAQAVQDGRLDVLEADTTLSTHIADTNNPHSVTATQVGLGNVDNTSDSNKPVSTAQQTALDGKLNINGDGVVSGSSQITITESQISDLTHFTISDLPTGTVSSSVQVDVLQTTNFTDFSSSIADTFDGLSSNYVDLIGIPSGIISSSEQLAADFLDTLGDNVVSSSAQIDLTQTTNYASGIKLKLDAENVFSSSQQVELVDVTGFNTFSSSISTTFDGLSSNYVDLIGIPADIISGSDQISITSANITDVAAFSQSGTYANLRAQATTAGDVGLGNVTNESKAIMFTSPTFTGTVSGVTATHVGLGNVTNESKETMFTSPTFTGTVSGVTATHVGLGNVTNTSDANKPVSTAQQTALNLKANLASPTFTGTVIAPTPSNGDDSTKVATTAFVMQEVSDLIGGAGAAFDTLLEISASIANGDSDVVALTTTVGGKLQKDQNLSDLTNAGTARTNLGLGSLATLSTVNAATITDNSVGAAELNVTGNGTTAQFLRSDGDGTFTWATPTDTNTTYSVGNGGLTQNNFTDALKSKLDGIAESANNYSLPAATSTVLGGIELFSNTVQSVAATAVSATASRTYGIQLNSAGQAVVNVPWSDTNTTYTRSSFINQDVDTTSNVNFNTVNINATTASTTKTTGALIVDGGVGVAGALNVGGDVVAYASSDRRLKDNIVNIENPIEKVQKLNGVTWDWNDNADELQQSLPNVGVIAQEVEEVFPQLVHDRENGYKGVDYAKLTGLLIEAVKEQQKQIDELKSRLG